MEKKITGVGKDQGVMGRPREFDTDAALEKEHFEAFGGGAL